MVLPAHDFLSSSANSRGGMENVSRPVMRVTVLRPWRVLIDIVIGWSVPFLRNALAPAVHYLGTHIIPMFVGIPGDRAKTERDGKGVGGGDLLDDTADRDGPNYPGS